MGLPFINPMCADKLYQRKPSKLSKATNNFGWAANIQPVQRL